MNTIKEYLVMVVSACVVGVMVDIISSSVAEKHKDLENVIHLGITACLLLVIFSPIVNGVKCFDLNTDSDFPYDSITEEYDKYSFLETEAERDTKEYIFNKTGIKARTVRINMESDDNGYVFLSEAIITLELSDMLKADAVKSASSEALGREAVIVYAD